MSAISQHGAHVPARVLLVLACFSAAADAASVAIVGGGFAGASAAWHLSKSQPGLSIDIFEADRIGGRARYLTYKNETLEVGASIVWEKNFLVLDTAQELGLQIQWLDGDQSEHSSKNNRLKRRAKITNTQPASHDSNQDDSSKTVDSRIDPQIDTDSNISDSQDSDSDNDDYEDGLAIWDGSQFVMTQVSGSVWEYASLFWRYGASPHYYGQHANKVWEDNFRPIYDYLNNGTFFTSPEELLQLTGLWEYTQQNCRQHMQDVLHHWYLWGQEPFTEELAGGVNRCNYNQQSSTMNALAGLVSYLPAAGGRVFAIQGGNSLLADTMARAANATVHLGARVVTVEQQSDDTYTLTVTQSEGQGDASGSRGQGGVGVNGVSESMGPYDAVVIASPLEFSGVKVKLLKGDTHVGLEDTDLSVVLNRQYQTTVTTFVTGGELQSTPFGLDDLPPAKQILVTEHAKTDFSSISVVKRIGKERVYKVFSESPLPQERILELFGADAEILSTKVWSAYPLFSPPERFAPFLLGPSLCYSSALENSASALEVAMIAGKNCALLISDQLSSAAQRRAKAKDARIGIGTGQAQTEVTGQGTERGAAAAA